MNRHPKQTKKERGSISAMSDVQLTIFIADEQENAAKLMEIFKVRKVSLKERREMDDILDRIAFAQKCWLER